jgi:NADH-quinone oxidoreductase subunit F
MQPTLLKNIHTPDSHRLSVYEANGGYQALKKALREMKPQDVIDTVKASGLRGRGGAGFPCGVKWGFMPKEKKGPHYLACNADEGEPGTFKDIVLMTKDPHLVIEACILSSYAIQADTCFIYIRGEFWDGHRIMKEAIAEAERAGYLGENILGSGYGLRMILYKGAGAYICGEESALMESTESRRGMPRLRPPFPAQCGIYGHPTTVNNVETLSNVPFIVERGVDWYKSLGSNERNTGPKLYCLSGHVERPGVYEDELGIPLRKLIEEYGGGVRGGKKLKAVCPGGSSSAFLTPDQIDTPMDFDSVMEAGSMLGSAAIVVLDETVCLVQAAVNMMEFYHHESCGQCTPCREGCGWMLKIFRRIEAGKGTKEDLDLLLDIMDNMKGNTVCAFGDGACMAPESLVRKWRPEFEAHITEKRCPFNGQGK